MDIATKAWWLQSAEPALHFVKKMKDPFESLWEKEEEEEKKKK